MKFIRNISLFLLSIFLLASCTNQFNESPIAENETEIEVEEPMKEITCNMLKGDEREEECNRALNDVATDMLFAEIQLTFDLERCDKLPKNIEGDCINYIQSSGVQGPVSDTELEVLRDAMTMVYPKIATEEDKEIDVDTSATEGYYDSAKCALLITPGLKEYCEKSILILIDEEKAYEIIEQGNSSLCDSLQTEEMKTFCNQEFDIGLIDETEIEELITEESDAEYVVNDEEFEELPYADTDTAY